MTQTVIGTFDNTTDADDAVRDLVDAGISRTAIQLHSQETGTTPAEEGTTHVSGDHEHAQHGFFARIEHFFSNLVGDNDRPAEFSHYHEAIRRGGALVSVEVSDDDDFDRVKRVLDDAGAVDIDERAAQWQSTGYTPYRVGGTDESTVSTTGGHLGEGTQGASQDMPAGRAMAAGQTLSSTETSTGGRTVSSSQANLDPMLERDAPSTLQPGAGSSLGLGADMGSTSGIGSTAGMGSTSGMGTVSTTGASSPAGLTSGARSASDDTGTGISSGMGMGTGSGMGSGSGVGASTGLGTEGGGSTTASGLPTTTGGGIGTNREIASTVDTGTGMGTTGLGTDMGPLDSDLDDDLASGRNTSATGEEALPVIEEELAVGKRKVQTGAYRVYTRTTSTPVTEDVTLREEHASIERRPVDRPATDADRKEAYVEVKETDETPVIQKTARVVEEVVVGKESSQRTETIHDTLRGTEVEVERVEGDGKNDGTLKTPRP
ncbi:hypothetical protein GCM10007242_15460 [Pigmentiphaga litoralis]|uniref:YsnF/AvaK domain-containing protein n=1 Tax=Pigmentiphaga litoralis TaxID=516702 RepID=UPI0019BA0F57|nr:YsnF/AvaK domain-containing protein [Pigmentiphaga litoralis]GGX10350.1 hypothetical protein GCM10007242_15460 [Pigmentiphaga litoralis]